VSDPVLDALLAEASTDPGTLGLILSGSRAVGAADATSDYDIVWVLTDAARDERKPTRTVRRFDALPPAEIEYSCPRDLAAAADEPGWWTYGYVSAQVLLDKTGELVESLARLAAMPEHRARTDAYESYDAYLNSFVRSTRSWERGDELGARIHATQSVAYLVRALFALERRWAPYHDRLLAQLPRLAAQGWEPGYLEDALFAIVRTGDPSRQRELERRVERLMDSRGVLAHSEWGDALGRAKRR
jgi:hypothetical protein